VKSKKQVTEAAEKLVKKGVKPKAKKRAPVVEMAPEVVAEPAAEVIKPRKIRVSKAKAAPVEQEVAAEEVAEVNAPAKEAKTAKSKAAAKPAKKQKGRDLVTEEPGAQEVAEVMEDVAADAAAVARIEEESEEADAKFAVPEPKLERLQKILAKAGISSRRKAEELILGGRVQINGKVVMELGTKADMARDHVRVDGKLLQGAERIRYFVLNKPKGFVTTVSDPEGRPTVMQFFAGERERLYPVGRLDYLSEGLLLVTNDGDLANKLTKAASGVEKTYLVKVAGQPTEDMLDVLRRGVVIEKGRPGEHTGRVRTAPAQIRQVREGDNPWYEVIIIEGRNRELRKMFEEIGHHVEKIRRVGYGPLVLDLEPGKLRELEAEEVHQLRLAADGKLKSKKKRIPAAAQLPTVAGKTVRYKKADGKPGFEPRSRAPRPEFQQESRTEAPTFRRAEPGGKLRPSPRTAASPSFRPDARPERSMPPSAPRPGTRPDSRPPAGPRPPYREGGRPGAAGFKAGPRSSSPGVFDRGGKPGFGGKPRRPEPPVTEIVLPPRKPLADDVDETPRLNPDFKPGFRTGGQPQGKPAFRKDGPPRAAFSKPSFDRPKSRPPIQNANDAYDEAPRTGGKIRVEPVEDRPRESRPPASRGFDRPGAGKPFRPATGRPTERPARPGGPSDRPFRPQGDRPASGTRPFRPRTDGPPSGERSFRPADRAGRSAGPAGSRPFRPAANRPATGRTGTERDSEFRPRQAGPRPSGARPSGRSGPPRFEGREGASTQRPRPGDGDRTRTFKPGAPKKFGARPASTGGPGKTGPDGEPRKKERWRNSFTGKNKGRPKPKKDS